MAEINLNSISGVLSVLTNAFKIPKEPARDLPPPLILTGAKLRPGLSSSEIASRIISRMSEAGLPVGDVFGDGPNTTEALMVIIIEEIINSVLTEARIDIVIPPGGIDVVTIGVGNMGAPVTSKGSNLQLIKGQGVIS